MSSKRAKYFCKYNPDWEKSFTFISKVKDNANAVHCSLCKKDFSIGAGGVNDIKRHKDSDKHKKMEKVIATTKPLPFAMGQDHCSKVSELLLLLALLLLSTN